MDTPDFLPALERLDMDMGGASFCVTLRRRPGNGPAVVLLHGLGCDQETFAAFFQRKELRARPLVSFDFPGCGRTPRPGGFSCTLPAYAHFAQALLDFLGLDRVHVLGHSLGGAVGVLLSRALEADERVVSLVSVEGTMVPEDCGLSREIAKLDQATFATRLFPSLPTHLPEKERAHFALERTRANPLHEAARSLVTWADRGSLLADFLDMRLPRLYVHGELSRKGAVLERLRGHVELARISGAGHFPMHDNAGGFHGAVAAFLDRTSNPSAP